MLGCFGKFAMKSFSYLNTLRFMGYIFLAWVQQQLNISFRLIT